MSQSFFPPCPELQPVICAYEDTNPQIAQMDADRSREINLRKSASSADNR